LLLQARYGLNFYRQIGLSRERTWFYYIMIGFLCGNAFLFLGWAIGKINILYGNSQDQPFSYFPVAHIKYISILAVLIAPIMEEIIFRGFLQTTLYRYMHPVSNIVFVSLLFTGLHSYYYGNFLALTYVFILGILLGSIRHLTASIIPCMIGHFLNNLMAAVILLGMDSGFI